MIVDYTPPQLWTPALGMRISVEEFKKAGFKTAHYPETIKDILLLGLA